MSAERLPLAAGFDRLSRLTEELCGYVPDPVGTPEESAAEHGGSRGMSAVEQLKPREIAAQHIAWCRQQGMTPAQVLANLRSLQVAVGRIPRLRGWVRRLAGLGAGRLMPPTWDEARVAITQAARELRPPR